ncbi:photosystem II stability/assembly factor-like uncharacterized protein [Paenibacillus shirakamiensis]|uniref:Photosystem II stability/assembly factor-like uncharacterized protein n=1 Tax=Paenibacillus shirakamiensis TaxID=1265935 RepID=A0ABS4JFW2_9BACL|nr:YCF48-related protein [Paenibacillus shirakamiensis]MBP1999856.1 photosystem II stability/assembly factor-like uncharacterized protein [Paenibacillus shirakamiensis]
MRLRFTTLLILILFGSLLSACSSEESLQSKSAKVDNQEDGQTLTVLNQGPSTVANVVTDNSTKYQIQTKLTDFELVTENAGIAWGLTRSELRLYFTQDSGKVWTNISPSTSIQFPSNPQYGKNLFFIDIQTGWIVRNSSGTAETVVLRTTDGGVNWKVSSLPDQGKVSAIHFVSKDNGWVATTQNVEPSSEHKAIYSTQDGGITWKKIMDSGNASHPNAIPDRGYLTGVTFTDKLQGYASTSSQGVPHLYTTTDGGFRWMEHPKFFSKDIYEKCEAFPNSTPTFFRGSTTQGWISVGCTRNSKTKFNGYFTSDAGKSWRFVAFPLKWQSGDNQNISPTFLSASEGWAVQSNKVYHTLNQGEAWTALPDNSVLESILEKYPEIVKIQFSSSKVGWMLVQKNELKQSRLLQTLDGGIHWRML